MNQQYLSFLVIALANVLPLIGLELGNEQLTVFVQVGASIVGAVWGLVAGYRSGTHTLGGRSL